LQATGFFKHPNLRTSVSQWVFEQFFSKFKWAVNPSINEAANNSLKRTEALARWLRRAQAGSPRINIQWTRGQVASICARFAAA
jgi:hypothetical protein